MPNGASINAPNIKSKNKELEFTQEIKKKAKTLWLQLDIISPESKLIVESEGINFVENKCTKIEYKKLLR